MEGDYSAGAKQLDERTQDCQGIGKKLQNEAADDRVERFGGRQLRNIGLREAYVVQIGFGDARAGANDGIGIALDANYFAGRASNPGGEHGNIANAGANVQDALAGPNACFAEKAFGEGCEDGGLANEAFVLRFGAAEGVGARRTRIGHDDRGL